MWGTTIERRDLIPWSGVFPGETIIMNENSAGAKERGSTSFDVQAFKGESKLVRPKKMRCMRQRESQKPVEGGSKRSVMGGRGNETHNKGCAKGSLGVSFIGSTKQIPLNV